MTIHNPFKPVLTPFIMSTFDLELERIVREIKEKEAKLVLIQLPDGLKPQAKIVVDAIESKTKAKALIWLSSCYGGCDIPLGLPKDIDLLIAFGHNQFPRLPEGW